MSRTGSLARAAIVVGLSLAYFTCVFQIGTGIVRTAGLGDWIDPYFINALLEHWAYSLRHTIDPASPIMFYPVPGTLGYSHGLILFAPVYGVLRLWLDPLRADTAMAFIVIEAGTLALYWLLRRFVGTSFVESLLLTALFATSANVISGSMGSWLQRASVFLVPPIILVVLVAGRTRPGASRLVANASAGLFATLLFTQDFYTAALAVLVALLHLPGTWPDVVPALRRAWHTWTATGTADMSARRAPATAWLVLAGVAAAWGAFIWIHPVPEVRVGTWKFSAENYRRPLVVAALAGGWFAVRRWQLVSRAVTLPLRIARLPADALALGSGALAGFAVFLWIYLGVYLEGRVFPHEQLLTSAKALALAGRQDWLELFRAFLAYDSARPFMLVFAVAVLACLPGLRLSQGTRRLALWSALVGIVVLATSLKIGDLALWTVLFGWMPGLSIIRDPKRIIYLYELGVVFVTGLFLIRLPARSILRLSIAGVMLVLLVTGWNKSVFDFERPLSAFAARVEAPVAIDGSCRSFYVTKASAAYMSQSGHLNSLYAMDALFIAMKHSIPTLNGYSAWTPEGWGLANPQEPGYDDAVVRWIKRYQLRNVCELDIEARTMTPTRLVR